MNNQQFQQWRRAIDRQEARDGWRKPLIMGILNATPDSFSDGGQWSKTESAVKKIREMIEEGADIIDIGGESSSPGKFSVSCVEELARVIPIIEKIREESDVCLSIDTTKPEVMRAAIDAGATMINDVTALRAHTALQVAADCNVPICLMHMQGVPLSMQQSPKYPQGVIKEVCDFFEKRIAACLNAGISSENIILDPGFGFGKSSIHNLEILRGLAQFHRYDFPILLGASRKNTIGEILQKPINDRLIGGIAIAVFAAMKGVAIIRTHDVDATRQALKMLHAINLATIEAVTQ